MREKQPSFSQARRFGVALFTTILVFALVETSIWLTHSVLGGKPRLLRSDPELGWANREGFTGSRKLGDGSGWRVSLDRRGFRTLDLQPEPEARRIVALGGSFVFGDGIDSTSHFLHAVGRKLPAAVTNLAVVGYSTDQELLAFRRFRGDADVVLLGTYLTNDLDGNLSHSGGNMLRFKPKFADCRRDQEPAPPPHRLLNRARHRSYVVTRTLGRLRTLAPNLALFDRPTATRRGAGGDPAWACYEALVDRIVGEAERRGVGRVLILLWSFQSSRPDPAAAPSLAARFAGRDVIVIDLDRAIEDSSIDPLGLYRSLSVDPGAHWNAAGHAFVADLVLQALGPGLTFQH